MAFPSLDEVVGQLRTIAEDDSIVPESALATLDVDSLDVLEWVYEIEEQGGFTIDDTLYDKESIETSTVRELYERLRTSTPT